MMKKKKSLNSNIINRIVYLMLLVFATALINNVGGAFSYALFFSVIFYLPLSIAYLFYIKSVLMIYQELEGRLMYKNRAEKYTLVIENTGVLTAGGIRLMAVQGVTVFGKDIIGENYELLPHEKRELESDIFLKYAGSYEAGITDIELKDVFGIIRLRYHIPAPLRVSVLPVVTDVADRTLSRLLDELVNGKRLVSKEQREESLGNDLRAYIAGDPVKQIHWKNYARSGELLVRLPEPPDMQMPTILLLPEQDDGSLNSIERRDYFLELAVSIANYFAKRRKPAAFIINNGENERMLVEDYESFQKFYVEITKGIKDAGEALDTAYDDGTLLILRERDNRLCLGGSHQ